MRKNWLLSPLAGKSRISARLIFATLFSCHCVLAQQPPARSDQPPTATGSPGGAQPSNSTEALQKATQNPVADLISVPLQNNSNFGIGSYDRTQNVLNIQPVIPTHLTQDWNLITRIIQPIVWQPNLDANSGGTFGLGDMNPTFFFSPARPGRLIWGVGPAFILPTATDPALGQGKWSIGPSFVALAQPGHWTLGVLVSNVWSFAGSSDRASVNQMLVQYFINYNLSQGWYVTVSPIITANWVASSAKNIWTVPFGGGVGRIMKFGLQPVNISAQVYANAVYPSGASPWGLRLQIAFLFPK